MHVVDKKLIISLWSAYILPITRKVAQGDTQPLDKLSATHSSVDVDRTENKKIMTHVVRDGQFGSEIQLGSAVLLWVP